ncbi:hypothetical protein [Oceanobacillus sp. J11TS1]|uniref:hypothetical protein n=1 Tax=Oceanobacillus sp. J11TS1 TaxID=2807191 RepID=UPI001B0EF1E3|nr:hypothetical protein [Oceanobacillus sp. J11TS1]GIO25236.1 hypothetical protein J11TS1_38170 [Oceanobacillus sp. J11TS1]
MRVILELLRIVLIFGILGAVGWGIVGNIYTINEETEMYSWLGVIAILLLLFVLYRNKLQFSGWYKGKAKLPKTVSKILILSSVLLFISPFLLGFLLS